MPVIYKGVWLNQTPFIVQSHTEQNFIISSKNIKLLV